MPSLVDISSRLGERELFFCNRLLLILMFLFELVPQVAQDMLRYSIVSLHYVNMSMQYTAIFMAAKNDNFQMKKYNIFLIFAQNINCGYTLEPPQ